MNIYPAYISKQKFKSWKPNYYFNDSKQGMIVLSCSKKLSALSK